MTKIERLQLNNLSKLVYGKSSRWQKMVENGELSDLTDENGRKYRGFTRYSVEEIKKIMEEIWAEEQERIKKDEEEKANSPQTN